MLRRAHHVLAFLVHFYVHSSPPSTNQSPIHVPASLAIPLVEVSRVLGIAPVLTFADTILWNYTLLDQSKPLSSENMTFQTLFTGTSDEIGFYHCCASIELRGVEALRIISSFQSMSNVHDEKSIAQTSDALSQLAKVIDELTSILQTVRCFCEPKVFYNAIRPWFRGSDAHGPGSPGWIFDGVEDSSKLELSGPSAGQSSMIHSLDVFLDVDHQMIKPRRKEPSEANKRADHTFMKRYIFIGYSRQTWSNNLF
jgi:indoleamine 2,3-dioxygenase